MEKQILVKVFNTTVEENYENGRIEGTETTSQIAEQAFPTLEEAEAWADNEYSEVGTKEYDSENGHVYYCDLVNIDDAGVHKPTKKQIKDYEKCKINLWNEEVEVCFYELTALKIKRNY